MISLQKEKKIKNPIALSGVNSRNILSILLAWIKMVKYNIQALEPIHYPASFAFHVSTDNQKKLGFFIYY